MTLNVQLAFISTQGVSTEYDDQIDQLQKQMLKLIEDNARQGAVSDEFDDAYNWFYRY